jgi:CrcB protein
MRRELRRRETHDLALVAAGAIPGAVLRWRLGQLAQDGVPPLPAWCDSNLVANLAGCLLIGVLVALPQRQRLFLWGGIGFCGSLTTFSSWMLQVSLRLRSPQPLQALPMLLIPLVLGLALTSLGYRLGRRLAPPQG